MTEGIRTRSRAMEEQLALINERQDLLVNKLETLCSSVDQHTELFETMQENMASQQAVMTDIMVKLTRLERPNPSPPLLATPPSPSITHTQPYHTITSSTQSNSQIRLPKLEVPLFSGEGVLSWIFQIEHFFYIPPGSPGTKD